MKIPFKYTIKSFKARKLTTFITITGLALVIFVFTAVLMMAYGVEKTLVSTGSEDNVLITRKGSHGEVSSIIDGETQQVISTLPHIAKLSSGQPVISNEPVVVINLSRTNGEMSNITVRGVSQMTSVLRPQVKIVNGRMFNPALRELIAGKSLVKKIKGVQLGSSVKFAGNYWKIVGEFSSDGSGFDSELWGDAIRIQQGLNRSNTASSITLKLDNRAAFEDFRRNFAADRRLQQFEPEIEKEYFGEQSEFLTIFIRALGLFVTIIFSIGATIGAMITMYTAVANRTKEIGTMRALGFSRRSILTLFLLESLLTALSGAAIGIFLASFLRFFTISTLNYTSFTELAFSFALSPSIIVSALIFAVIMGFLGGFLPSLRAARLRIVQALKAE